MINPILDTYAPYSAEDVVWAVEFLLKHSMEFGESAPIDHPAHEKALEIRDWFRANWANAKFEVPNLPKV